MPAKPRRRSGVLGRVVAGHEADDDISSPARVADRRRVRRYRLERGQGLDPCWTCRKGVAFDGANIWVANVDTNNVTKLRASDGANLGTFPMGNSPKGVAFDGVHIWVANQNGVSKL